MTLFAECSKCGRGAEACQYCEHIGMSEDWDTVCDCGLADFSHHLMDCEARSEFQYVIASDHVAAQLPRVSAATEPGWHWGKVNREDDATKI